MLLGLVLGYWLLVIVGVIDAELDGDGDFGGEISDGHGHGHAHGSGGAGMSDGGGRVGRSGLFNFSDVPLTIAGSFVAIFMWLFSVWGNYYFNGSPGNRSLPVAIVLLFPNGLLSLMCARVAVIPFQKLFRAMRNASTESEAIVGREAKVASVSVDERYGQVEVSTNSVPLLVNARTEAGAEALPRGTRVVITAAAEDGSYYFVRPAAVADSVSGTNNLNSPQLS